MTDSPPSPEDLAREIIESTDDIDPFVEDVTNHVRWFRQSGLPDEDIRETIPSMFRIKEEAAKHGAMGEPGSEEIRVLSMPEEFQREDWT